MFDLLPEHDATRLAIRNSWTDDQRQARDAMSLSDMLRCFEARYWDGERADEKTRRQNARRKARRKAEKQI